ncbi:MAG: long-chain fatty acid--CoA ligase [Deltaproteobacteria bacterium]|nr:long-chain fatty acid--CoA ligase [Deltaproteobacteria bacterium]
MAFKPWDTPFWPEGVPREITGYEKPLFSLLDESAKNFPNQTYTIFNGRLKSYADVKATSDRLAHFLSKQGIQKGARVAVFLPNLPHFPEIFFGVLKAGATCVTCNPLYTATELNYQLKDSGARIVFCMDHPQFYPTVVEAIKRTDVEQVVICSVKSYLPPLMAFMGSLLGKIPKAERHEPGHLLFDDVVKQYSPEPPEIEIDPAEDLALILYTGGTTGRPKGACLTHSNFMANVTALDEWSLFAQAPGAKPERLKRGGYQTILGILPWYHSFGLTCGMLHSCLLGGKLVCIPDPRAGKPPFAEVLKAVQKYRPTLMPAVPTIFVAFVNHPHIDNYDLSSFLCCVSGGAPLPPEVFRQFEAKTGAIIYEGYGLSETSPIASGNPANTETRKIGSIGFPFPSTDIKVLDLDTGEKELPRGEDGEIAICGLQVMKGYWNKPEETAAVFRNIDGMRYFLSGDIGHIDEDGFIVITDRKKDLVLVGGFNVYPREVEDVLFEHPKVAMAAVIGVPDERSGEAVKAFIQLKPGETAAEEEILSYCKENMAGYKRPRLIEFRDELPVSAVGKVLRRVLRDEELKKGQKE